MTLEVCRLNGVGMIVALHSQYPSFRSIGPVSPCARFAPSTKHSRVHCFSTSFLQHSIILVLLLLAFYASRLSFFAHLTWFKGPRIVCVLLAGPSPHSLNRLDAYFTHHDCTRAIPWPRRTSPRGVSPWPTSSALARRLSKIRSRRLLRPNYGDLVAWVSW
jgi:hypothetical protein